MSALDQACAGLFAWGWQTTWQVTVLVLVVATIQRLFGRGLAARGRYALWLLVVVRLALPALPELRFALVPWRVSAPQPTALPAVASLPAAFAPRGRTPAAPEEISAPIEKAEEFASPPRAALEPEPEREARPPAHLAITPRAAPAPSKVGTIDARTVAVLAWLLIAALLMARDLAYELRFRRRLRRLATPIEDPALLAQLEDARAALGVRRPVRLARFDELRSPALSGLLAPRVLLPQHALARLAPDELAGVLRHELAHVRRGDVLTNVVFVVLRRLWWFHPIVHFALARTAAAQEAARDAEALSGDRSPAPLTYARTLLALAEVTKAPGPAAAPGAMPFLRAPSDTTRRILMSVDFRPPRLAQGLLGAVLLIGLGWLSLTSAASGDGARRSGRAEQGGPLREVVVERHQAPPAWRMQMEERLEMRVSVDAQDAPIEDVVAYLRELAKVNVIVQMEAFYDLGHEQVSMKLDEVSVRNVLDRLCEPEDVGWCLAREAVFVGWAEELPEELDLRFYKVAPLLEGLPADDVPEAMDRLATLVQETTGLDRGWRWEREGVWIETWDDLLVIRQSEEMHARTLAFLNRVLNRGAEPEPADDAWRAGLEQQMASLVHVDFDEVDGTDLLEALSIQTGVPIRFSRAFLDEEGSPVLSLHLSDMSLANALGWVAHLSGTRVLRRPGELVLGRELELGVVFHPVGDLFGEVHAPRDEELRDRVEETIRNMVLPETWDETPWCMITYWRDQMIVVQCPEAQAQIAALLDAVRRATRP